MIDLLKRPLFRPLLSCMSYVTNNLPSCTTVALGVPLEHEVQREVTPDQNTSAFSAISSQCQYNQKIRPASIFPRILLVAPVSA
jgi:hypothetical protein